MTRHLTNALAGLYALLAVAMLRCALVSYQHGSLPYTTLFSGVAVALATAIAHHAYHRDELRAALLRLERAARPPGPPEPAIDGVVAVAMAGWCCDPAVLTNGDEHDPARCTRKDQTT